MRFAVLSFVVFFLGGTYVEAEIFKKLPPDGIQVSEEVRSALAERVGDLQKQLELAAKGSKDSQKWEPDVEVLLRAVDLALEQNLFFKKSEPNIANKLLDEAGRRLTAVGQGKRGLALLGLESASKNPQLLVGGFRSHIDDSVQPYGLVVPTGYAGDAAPHRVDVWLHGRGDTKTEIPFLHERMTKVGLYAPKNTFVLHPFGRHCNAFKFAGETDVYEAIDHLGTIIPIDSHRMAMRGFSMGGAGCWHLGVHHPGRWFAINPGAGFVDTITYQKWTKKQPFEIDSSRAKLLQLYDVLPWVENLRNTNTVAYSGEVDKQKQAADRVFDTAKTAGFEFPYVIGKGMGHKIDPQSAQTVEATIQGWADSPKISPRQSIDFKTCTLRYSQVDWLTVTGLEEHWKFSRVQAKITSPFELQIDTQGVTRLELNFQQSPWPKTPGRPRLTIDGQRMKLDDWGEQPGLQCELARSDKQWKVVEELDNIIRKKPGLQGPIDDAFYDRFVFVLPTRPAKHGVVQRWIDRELKYAQNRWRTLMRGEVRVINDTAVTQKHIDRCHLICFGDFTSNQYLRSVASNLPITWTRDELKVGSREFNPNTHAAVFCFPNPSNPDRYVVVNSGMTFREFSNVSNSRQIAMLPDWAVMDLSNEPDDSIFAGKIVADGFFDEQWNLKP